MKNRYIINLFVNKDGKKTRKNFSCQLETYSQEILQGTILEKLDLNTQKWEIDSHKVELIEKENVVIWEVILKRVEK